MRQFHSIKPSNQENLRESNAAVGGGGKSPENSASFQPLFSRFQLSGQDFIFDQAMQMKVPLEAADLSAQGAEGHVTAVANLKFFQEAIEHVYFSVVVGVMGLEGFRTVVPPCGFAHRASFSCAA